MIEKILKIMWFPVVLGVLFALWAEFSVGVGSDLVFGTFAIIGATFGVFWVVTAMMLRIAQPQYAVSRTKQIMFDIVCYPTLVFMLLCMIDMVYLLNQ